MSKFALVRIAREYNHTAIALRRHGLLDAYCEARIERNRLMRKARKAR